MGGRGWGWGWELFSVFMGRGSFLWILRAKVWEGKAGYIGPFLGDLL